MATIFYDNNLSLKTCPYNKAHKVKASRFQAHVANCAQQHIHLNLRVCPFNATHRLPDEEYQRHVITCPDNRPFIRTEMASVKKVIKIEATADDEEEDDRMKGKDIWSDEYMEGSSSKNYDILNDSNVSAEWLFAKRFSGRNQTTFTDTLYVQKMSYEERKKYQMMCCQRIKQIDINANKDNHQSHGQTPDEQEIDQQSVPTQEPELIELRPPIIQNPFAKGVNSVHSDHNISAKSLRLGIGRGLRGKGVSYRRTNY